MAEEQMVKEKIESITTTLCKLDKERNRILIEIGILIGELAEIQSIKQKGENHG